MPERAMVHGTIDADAVDAARKGQLPQPAPGMAGESGPSEPSRAEVLALRPDLADSVPGTPTDGDRATTALRPPAQAPRESATLPEPGIPAPTKTGDVTVDRRIDAVIDAVFARLDAVRHGVATDIYVWSDGRVTGPPSGNEKGNGTLLTVVTPGALRPTRDALRETIVAGLES